MYLASNPAIMPIYAHLQPIHGGGGDEVWHLQRGLVRGKAHLALPSMGRKWLRSRPIKIVNNYSLEQLNYLTILDNNQ